MTPVGRSRARRPAAAVGRSLGLRRGPGRAGAAGEAGALPAWLPAGAGALREPAAQAMLRAMRQVPVRLAGGGEARASFVGPAGPADAGAAALPVMLLHGFDSNCLEYRRLLPLLQEVTPTFAVDVLGWGFSGSAAGDYGPAAKRDFLYSFWRQHVGTPVVLAGSSLGGAAAIDLAVHHPDMVAKLVLIDAQGYIEGAGPMAGAPDFLARLGIRILKTDWLRQQANKLSYFDKERFATEDALRIAGLHTQTDDWLEKNLSFMQSGGYAVADQIKMIEQETLIIWGEDDEILEQGYATRFLEEIRHASLVMVPECGHVCHLEHPDTAFKEIAAFCAKTAKAGGPVPAKA